MIHFRWLLVPAAAAVGFYTAFFGVMILYSLVDGLCPEEQRSSGMCTAGWFRAFEDVLQWTAPALAGLLWVVFATAAAPLARRLVAPLVLAAGVVTVGVVFEEWWGPTMASAVAGGVLGWALTLRLPSTSTSMVRARELQGAA